MAVDEASCHNTELPRNGKSGDRPGLLPIWLPEQIQAIMQYSEAQYDSTGAHPINPSYVYVLAGWCDPGSQWIIILSSQNLK